MKKVFPDFDFWGINHMIKINKRPETDHNLDGIVILNS